MSGIAKAIGTVASILSFIPGPHQPIAAAIAITANVVAAATAKRPPAQGSVTRVQIAANLPSPYIMGLAYSGGSRVHQIGYGSENDVPNAYLFAVDVHSVAGPLESLEQVYADFTPINFLAGDGPRLETGYYSNNTLYRDFQLGETPESNAPGPQWWNIPDTPYSAPGWSPAHKISGKATIAYSARFPKDGKRFGSGLPQFGATWKGVKCYDPRLDSTYPGGDGPHRWADPADTEAFSAAKATWTWSTNPALHALRYALGSWERDETDEEAPYRKVFGVGGSIDQIVVADFVEAANVDDANGWSVNGVIFEGRGIDKWNNLSRIGMAGGFKPVFKGARLGLKVYAPRVAVDTVTLDDIGEGEVTVQACRFYEQRVNTMQPYFISPDHKWESTPTETPIQVTEYVTQDGEEKPEDWPLDLVTNANQAAQLTGYELVDRREQEFSLPLLKRWPAGSLLEFDQAVIDKYGLQHEQAELTQRTSDWANMRWSGDFVTENPGKHVFALALTGTTGPVPEIPTPEERDGAATGGAPSAPSSDDWSVTPSESQIGPVTRLALVIAGTPSADTIAGLTGVQIDYRKDGDPEWISADFEAPDTEIYKEIDVLMEPETEYEVSIRYFSPYGQSERLILNATTGELEPIDWDGGDPSTVFD
jgi:hypothetical protein